MTMGSGLSDVPLVGEPVCSVGNPNPQVYLVQNEESRATSVAYCHRFNRSSYTDVPENRVLIVKVTFSSTNWMVLLLLDPKFTDFGCGSVLKNRSSLYQKNTLQSGDSVDPSNCTSVGRGQEASFISLSASGVCVRFQGGCKRRSLNLSPSDKKRKTFDDASRLTPTENADIEHGRNEITEYENEDEFTH